MNRKSWGAVALAGGTLLLADTAGVRPRPDAHSYPASVHVPNATVAAEELSAEQVRHRFTADLNKNYLVLEVAVYPDRDGSVKISPEDFMLKFAGQGALVRPEEPAVIASVLRGKDTPATAARSGRSTIDVVPTASVGRVSEVYTDPTTGQRKHDSGWVTSAGVAVYGPVNGSPGIAGPTASRRDRETTEAELADKSLPEGTIQAPTAGYLYFPVAKGVKKNAAVELQYLGQSGDGQAGNGSGNVKLQVPAAASH